MSAYKALQLAVVSLLLSLPAYAQEWTQWQHQPSQQSTVTYIAQYKGSMPRLQRNGSIPAYFPYAESIVPLHRSAGLMSLVQVEKDGPRLLIGASITLGQNGLDLQAKRVRPRWPYRMRWDAGRITSPLLAGLKLPEAPATKDTRAYWRPTKEEGDWAYTRMTFAADGGAELALTLSRLTPAILLESNLPELRLLGGINDKEDTWYLAASDGQRVSVAPLSGQAIASPDLSSGWMLVFWGPRKAVEYKVYDETGDPPQVPVSYPGERHPLLLVFSRNPDGVAGGDGLTLRLGESPAKIAIMPLYGLDMPSGEEMGKWKDGLPEPIRQRCDWWAQRLSQFPRSVRETYSYDPAADRVTTSERVEYVTVRAGGTPVAPVPPTLALAAAGGFPVEYSQKPAECDYRVMYGPYLLVDGTREYTWSVRGLSKYLERPVIGPSNVSSKPLEDELAAEVDKMLEVDDLAPWPFVNRRFGAHTSYTYWKMPTETAYFLAQIMPVLDSPRQQRLANWLEAFAQKHPLLTTPSLKTYESPRREWYEQIPADDEERRVLELRGATKRVTSLALRGLVDYYTATGETPDPSVFDTATRLLMLELRGVDWATGLWNLDLSPELPPEARLMGNDLEFPTKIGNQDAANLIGYLRLAKLCGRADSSGVALAWGRLARVLAARLAVEKYSRWIYPPDGPKAFDEFWSPNDGVDQVQTMDQFEVFLNDDPARWRASLYHAYWELTPEVGRFLHDYARKEATDFLQAVDRTWPSWYIGRSGSPLGGDSGANPMLPELPYSLFMARAWIMGESPDQLRQRIDISQLRRGDYFFMHKLAETIKAFRTAG